MNNRSLEQFGSGPECEPFAKEELAKWGTIQTEPGEPDPELNGYD